MSYKKHTGWQRRGKDFTVEIVCTENARYSWSIYAYIYPDHWLFQQFNGESFWQPATEDLPLHGGVTFMRCHEHGGSIDSYQVGCDYQHLHDDRYGLMGPGDNSQFTYDADKLFKYLNAPEQPTKEAGENE